MCIIVKLYNYIVVDVGHFYAKMYKFYTYYYCRVTVC